MPLSFHCVNFMARFISSYEGALRGDFVYYIFVKIKVQKEGDELIQTALKGGCRQA